MMDSLLSLLTDPVLSKALGATLSIVFLAGAWQKLKEPEVFAAAVDNYRLLPAALTGPAARLIPLVELAAGLCLLFPETARVGGLLASVLLATVTGAVAFNLLRGHTKIDCGCGGLSSQPLSWSLVLRNAVLLAMVFPAAGEAAGRALVWADYFTVAGGVLSLVGLYAAANQLMTNAPFALAVRNK